MVAGKVSTLVWETVWYGGWAIGAQSRPAPVSPSGTDETGGDGGDGGGGCVLGGGGGGVVVEVVVVGGW